MWESVQLEIKRRRAFAEKHDIGRFDYATEKNPFAGKVICGCCGGIYGRKVWNSTDERLKREVWQCNNKYAVKGEKSCENKHVDERDLQQAFISAFNEIIENKDSYLEKWKEMLKSKNPLERYRAKQFIKIFKKADRIEEFDVSLFFEIVEEIKVFDGEAVVKLRVGTCIEVDLYLLISTAPQD